MSAEMQALSLNKGFMPLISECKKCKFQKELRWYWFQTSMMISDVESPAISFCMASTEYFVKYLVAPMEANKGVSIFL